MATLVLALSLGHAGAEPQGAVEAVHDTRVAGEAPGLPRATPESVGLAAAPLEEATALLKRFVAERKIAGAVAAVARRGKLAYVESAGVQDLATRAPMTERSLFR